MANTDLINEGLLAKYHDEVMKTHIVGGVVFDISAYNASGNPLTPATYADLAAALGTNGANVPVPMRKGGMTVKYVRSSDNEYVQFRYMNSSIAVADFTNVANWQGVDSVIVKNSHNLAESGAVEEAIPLSNSSVEEVDLAFSDELGNAIATLKNGHIKTKEFDSEKIGIENITEEFPNDFDLALSDKSGYILAIFENGHIKTKKFDSANFGDVKGHPYSGERINTNSFEFNYELYFNEIEGGQGSACYGKYLFQFFNKNPRIDIYDMTTKTMVQQISFTPVNTYHCNNANFGNEFAQNTDYFPLLYVSQENANEHKCLVYRITGNEGEFAATLVQTITFPEPSDNFMWYPNMMIDKDRDKMIVCGLGNNPYTGGTNNTIIYKTFPLPKLSAGDVTLNINEVEDTIVINNFPTCQGCFVLRSIVYAVFGFGSHAQLNVIDLLTHKVLSRVDLTNNGLAYEPEGCFLYEDALYVNFVNGNIIKFKF